MKSQVSLLSSEGVRDGSGAVVDPRSWRTVKTYDFLRVLALARGNPVSTESLIEMFWPSAGHDRGGTSVRTAACQIRKVLGQSSVIRVGHGFLLDASVDVDDYRALSRRVEAADARRHPAQVVMLVREAEKIYTCDVDVSTTDCALLHETCATMRTLRVHLLLEGAEAAGRCADWQVSLEFARLASQIEASERATRALIRAWYALGEPVAAIEEFEMLRERLADEYGVDPSPQTRAVYLDVVTACRNWPPVETPIGRDRQVREVAAAAVAALHDVGRPGSVVWLVGPGGSGREAVVRESARTLMLPLADRSTDLGSGQVLELLPDQGHLTCGLAEAVRHRASVTGRVVLAPVSEPDEGVLGVDDVVVSFPPLSRRDFGDLVAHVLQARATPALEDELYEESGGLPGRACTAARNRLASGDVRWSAQGVDSTCRSKFMVRLAEVAGLASLVVAALMGIDAPRDPEQRVVVVEERERRAHVLVGAS